MLNFNRSLYVVIFTKSDLNYVDAPIPFLYNEKILRCSSSTRSDNTSRFSFIYN